MKRPTRRDLILATLGVTGTGAALAVAHRFRRLRDDPVTPWSAGTPLARHAGVDVYDNGPAFAASHGRHYAQDGYYFGQKWQCVEFVKRYLYLARSHRMPDVMGHARSFFADDVAEGALNAGRGLLQFRQDGPQAPQPDDLVVFDGVGIYGHVGIVSAAGADFVEIVQQNKPPVHERLALRRDGGRFSLTASLPVLGWLRIPPAGTSGQQSAAISREAAGDLG